MDNNKIFISSDSRFEGEITAAHITIEGKIIGNITATSTILVKEDGWVEGDIQAPNVYLAAGCYHKGNIYLEDPENAQSAKINMNEFELETESKESLKKQSRKGETAEV